MPDAPDPAPMTPAESDLLAVAAKFHARGSLATARKLAAEVALSPRQVERLRAGLRGRGLWPWPVPTPADCCLERAGCAEDEDDPKAGIPSDTEVRAAIAAVKADWPEWRVEYERRKLYPPVEVKRGRVGGYGD